jgi:hypothetical protein
MLFALQSLRLKAGSSAPVILATQEAEIKRIMIQSQPQASSSKDPISKIPNKKKKKGLVEWLKR